MSYLSTLGMTKLPEYYSRTVRPFTKHALFFVKPDAAYRLLPPRGKQRWLSGAIDSGHLT